MATTEPSLYGLMAEFYDPTSLVNAAKEAHEAGYRVMAPLVQKAIDEALRRR